MGLSCRVLIGKKEDNISEVITFHKFEKNKCGGCPLCFGFKSSSYYTLLNLSENSLNILLYTSSEHTTSSSKHNYIEFFKTREINDAVLQFPTPFNLKLNLVADQLLFRDINTALNKFVMPDMQNFEVQEVPSWFS